MRPHITNNELLGIEIKPYSKIQVLEQIIKYIQKPDDMLHVVSLNSENIVIATENKEFMHAVRTAQICILDGVGIVLAARYHNIPLGERITGVDLMSDLITQAGNMRLRVLLIGGRPNLALSLSKCYQDKYSEAKFFGTMGFKDIQHPTKTEEAEILAIVRRNKPHMILAAFGSPWQELWLARHSKEFKGIVCMGVGQGFDVAGGLVKRAPVLIQNIGLEWLYRLIAQPWRWRRQLRLFKFMWLIITS